MNVTPEELAKKRQELANAISPGLIHKAAHLMGFYGGIPETAFRQGVSLLLEMAFVEGVLYGGRSAFDKVKEGFAERDAERIIKEAQKK